MSNPEALSGGNQYMLLDAGKGRYKSDLLSDGICEINEISLASSSCDRSRLNHNVSVSLSPPEIC